ncbi:MAG: hypothetical protein ACFB20_05720 [Opitutales bacterium]
MSPEAVRRTLYVYFAVLFVLHQDFWFREDSTLLFGFYPVTFAWHTAFSLAAALGWFLMVRFGWPADELEADAAPDSR